MDDDLLPLLGIGVIEQGACSMILNSKDMWLFCFFLISRKIRRLTLHLFQLYLFTVA